MVGDPKDGEGDDGALPPEVLAALQAGDRIGAIRRLRESHGLGLREAKEAIESMRLSPDAVAVARYGSQAPAPATLKALALPPAALSALHAGDRIGAIRIVREDENIGLKEAKDIVDAALRSQTGLQALYEEAAASRGGGRPAVWLIALAAGALVAWYVFGRR